jgi:hypothetical protein
MNYPALHLMMGYYTLSVNRAKSRQPHNYNQDGYEAYVQPAFGAASGIDHEVWAETFEGVLEAIDQSIAAKWYPHLLKGRAE